MTGTEPFTVAIDGPAAAGKGTISRQIAAALGFAHLDTGLLYRATGRRVLKGDDPVAAAEALTPEDFERDDLRTPEVSDAASRVAALPDVRQALVRFQQAFARRAGGAVLDGRDIGTVICPQAEVKLYVTASDTVRAHRRWQELLDANPDLAVETVLADLQERDQRDSERATAPLRPSEDAVVLDTSDMTIEAAVEAALAVIRAART